MGFFLFFLVRGGFTHVCFSLPVVCLNAHKQTQGSSNHYSSLQYIGEFSTVHGGTRGLKANKTILKGEFPLQLAQGCHSINKLCLITAVALQCPLWTGILDVYCARSLLPENDMGWSLPRQGMSWQLYCISAMIRIIFGLRLYILLWDLGCHLTLNLSRFVIFRYSIKDLLSHNAGQTCIDIAV